MEMRRLTRMRNFMIYETRRLLILIGRDAHMNRVIEVKRDAGCQLVLNEDYTKTYNTENLEDYLRGMKASLLHDRVYCLFGFVKLHESYYLIAITNASVVANIHGHDVYAVMGTSMIPVTYMPRKTVEETKYRALLNSVDLTNCCYFSYTYDLTSSMQRQEKCGNENENSVQDMFVWNHSAIEPLEYLEKECVASNAKCPHTWVTYIIHGSLQQKSADFRGGRGNHVKLHDEDTHHLRLLTYTLIARRSRHFAGARYLRRGVNRDGYVANEVETEQIITACMEKITEENKTNPEVGPAPENYQYAAAPTAPNFIYRSSSMVQVRGSIPLYWHHTNLLSPAPDITVESMPSRTLPEPFSVDLSSSTEDGLPSADAAVTFPAARAHFKRLFDRYGAHVDILNLVKLHHSKREVTVGMAYVGLCNALNSSLNLTFEGLATKKKGEKRGIGRGQGRSIGQATQAESQSSSEDEATDVEGEESEGAGAGNGAGTGVVTWNDSEKRVKASQDLGKGSSSDTPLSEDKEGESEGEDRARVVVEADYPVTYTVFDLLHYHEEEHAHTLSRSRSTTAADKTGEEIKDAAPTAAEHDEKERGEVMDVFEKLAEFTSTFQRNSGFFVQAPHPEGTGARLEEGDKAEKAGKKDTTAAALALVTVSFPLLEDDESQMRLSRLSFLSADAPVPLTADISLEDTYDTGGTQGQRTNGSNTSNSNSNSNSNGATAGDAEGEGAVSSADEEVWRDVTVEDIGSWISDGRLRGGAACQITQRGVLRTNCVDCLDRTNIAQFVHAKESILPQCRALGVCLTDAGLTHVLQMTTDLWTRHGNDLAVQYGGSGAMHSLAFVSGAATDGDAASSSGSTPSSQHSSSSSLSLSQGIQQSLSSTNIARMKKKMRDKARAKGADIKKFLEGVSGHRAGERGHLTEADADAAQEDEGEQEDEDEEAEEGETQEDNKKAETPAAAASHSGGPRFKLTGGIKNGIVAVNRYYANITSDFDKQLSMDLLLGGFIPSKDRPPIWDYDLQPQYHRVEASRYQVVKQETDGEESEGGKGHFDPLKWMGLGTLW